MNEINDFNNQNNINFSSYKRDITMPDAKEEFNKLFTQCKKIFIDEAKNRVPENGKFAPFATAMEIAGTNNIAILKVEADENEPKDIRRLSIGVRHENSDRLYSNYILKGTKSEIIEFLANNQNNEKIKDTIYKLLDKVEQYYSSI